MEEIKMWQTQCSKDEEHFNQQSVETTSNHLPTIYRYNVSHWHSDDLYSILCIYSHLRGTELLGFDRKTEELIEQDMETYQMSGDYLSNILDMEIGIFHDPIDTESTQLDAFCGNFTIRHS